jgi:hypothetical protein
MRLPFLLFLSLALSVHLFAQKDTCKIVVSNAITPNDGDECLKVRCNCPIKDLKIQVYDRWGTLLFEGTSVDKDHCTGWNTAPVAPGTYTWLLTCKRAIGEIWSDYKLVGPVVLYK